MDGPPIDSIDVRQYRLPLDPPFLASWDPEPRHHAHATFVRITAGDLEGVGSGDAMPGFAGHEHLILGRAPDDIERHVRVLENLNFHYGRMWPIEIALWDLIGKMRGEPLWRMLGATSDRVRVYASTGERQPTADRVESALRLRDAGFPAIKIRFHADDPADDIAVVRAVRAAVGDGMEILVDANQGWRMPWDTSDPWDLYRAIDVARRLGDLGVYWLEEPLDRHAYRELAALRDASPVRIAGGEGNRDANELREYIRHGSLDVYQHDVAWSTGILRGTQIAAEAIASGAMYTPHTWGDGLVVLANLHVATAVSNAPFVEFPYDPPGWTPERRDFILPRTTLPDGDGYVTLGHAPGLGVDIDWDAIERYRIR